MGEPDRGDIFVGRDYGRHDIVITPEEVALYCDSVDDHNPIYTGPSPFGGPVAPALVRHSETYAYRATPNGTPSWYLPNLYGNLHARQEWELFQPMMIGETVRTRSTVVERYAKRNRDYIVNEVLITGSGGRWLQRSRTHQSFLMESPPSGHIVDKEREKRSDRSFAIGDGPGAALAAVEKTITVPMCQAFSGPHRNYHTDREMAQAMGFPDIVVQGMMSVCFISELLTNSFGAGWYCGGKLNVNLVNVVWPDDRLAVRGKVREELPEGAKTRVHCDVWCEKADGVKTVVGTASALR